MLGFLVFASSCNITRYLEEDEVLYDKVEINLNKEDKINNPSGLKDGIYSVSRPKPNKEWLGLYKVNLWAHYKGDPDKGGFNGWLGRKGEEPVLLDSLLLDRNCKRMEAYLYQRGYYNVSVNSSVKVKNKLSTVTYNVDLQNAFNIDEITFNSTANRKFDNIIRTTKNRSFLKPGIPFTKDVVNAEKQRIATVFQNSGFFEFNKDYITFEGDTSHVDNSIDVIVTVNPPNNKEMNAHKSYKFNDIYIISEYFPGDTTSYDTISYKNYKYLTRERIFKPRVILEKVVIQSGNFYSLKAQQKSFENLLEMGVFKFVNIRFEEAKSVADEADEENDYLDTYIYLTPLEKTKLAIETELNSKTSENPAAEGANTSALGVALSTTYLNRNLFKGAERFSVNIYSGIEYNIFRDENTISRINTINVNPQATLTIPKFMFPLPKNLLPKPWQRDLRKSKVNTTFGLSTNFIQDVFNQYSLNATELQFGYDWTSSRYTRHILTPVSFAYSFLFNEGAKFDSLLMNDTRFAKSFEDILIIGGSYTYFNSNKRSAKKNKYFYRGDIELAGNVVALAEKTIQATKLASDNFNSNGFKSALGGLDYSQFLRLQSDYRYYINKYKTTLVARVYGGIAIPFGNSDVTPYIRQFYSGGSNGVRAFRIREVGPGSYKNLTRETKNFQFENTGDIKLEANLEYRFPIYWYLKGALFLDAGNVWTLREVENKPGAQFKANRFYKEFALGTGVGFRFDFSFFVLRFDLATPLYTPFLQEGDRWSIANIKLRDRKWRRDNLVLQLGIGYPF